MVNYYNDIYIRGCYTKKCWILFARKCWKIISIFCWKVLAVYNIKTLRASEIEEDDYFSRLIGEDITAIAKNLKEIHKKDKETSDNHSPLSEALDIIEEFEQATGALKKTLVVLGRQLDMNIPKMDPCDLQAFTNIIEKYSNAYKRQIAGRGKSRR